MVKALFHRAKRICSTNVPFNAPIKKPQHLTNCAQFAEYLKFYALPDIEAVNIIVRKELHLHHAVTENTKITDHNDN